jgi:transcription initiation factor TFIIB
MTLSRLAPYSPLSESKIRKHVSILRVEFEPSIPPARPQDFLPRVVSELGFDPDVEHRASGYLTRATNEELHIGKHPAAVAATAVYAAATDLDLSVNQQAVAEAADVSTVTISRHYQDIRQLSPPDFSL